MLKRTRYLLLLAGFIIFIILAPLIILYVRGLSYDFANHSFIDTGILAIRSDPSSLDVFLDGKLARGSQGDIRFLKPGEYTLSLSKNNYSAWGKKLVIEPNQVTWANPQTSKIYLFLNKPQVTVEAQGVLDFYQNNSQLFYLTATSLVQSAADSPSAQSLLLPKKVSRIFAQPANNNSFLLLGQSSEPSLICLVFNVNTKTFENISNLCSAKSEFGFDSGGGLYILENAVLYKINLDAKEKTPLLDSISAFSILNNNLYYLKIDSSSQKLFASDLNGQNSQLLLDGIPKTETNQIFVTAQKSIFLLLDQSLYKVSAALEKLADQIKEINFEPVAPSLVISNSGEINKYNFNGQQLQLLTRSSENLTHPQLSSKINYGLVLRNNEVLGLELDTRDKQNNYSFYQGVKLQKFTIDSQGQYLLVLDQGVLQKITIR